MRTPALQSLRQKIDFTRMGYIPAIAVACLGVCLSAVIYEIVVGSEQVVLKHELSQAVRRLTALLRKGFDEHRFQLISFRAFHAASEKVTREEFREYVKSVLAGGSSDTTFQWISRSPGFPIGHSD